MGVCDSGYAARDASSGTYENYGICYHAGRGRMVLDIAGGDTAVHQKIPQVRGGGSSALVLDFLLANVILKPLVARPRPCWIKIQ